MPIYLKSIFFLIPLFLTGCSNSHYWLQTMEQNNNFSYRPSDKKGVYEFEIKNFIDLDFDADKLADRQRLITNVLSAECPAGTKALHEKTMVSGKWVTGKPLRTYFVDVVCK